jgi:hypothetical protein
MLGRGMMLPYTLIELQMMMQMRDELNAAMVGLILGQPSADAYRMRLVEMDRLVEQQREL